MSIEREVRYKITAKADTLPDALEILREAALSMPGRVHASIQPGIGVPYLVLVMGYGPYRDVDTEDRHA